MASGGREDPNDFAKQMKNLLNSKFTQNTFEDQNKEQFTRDSNTVTVTGFRFGLGQLPFFGPKVKLKKEHLSLEDEISSYLSDNKMDQSSGEKPKRDNEEYYEEIEALGRFSN